MINNSVVILGPISSKSYFGGVAVFDEELSKGFIELGYDVHIFTEQDDVQVVDNVHKIKSFHAAKKILADINPGFVIASLEYGKYFWIMPKNTVKIYYIHGFFNRKYYGWFKSIIASVYQKILTKKADCILANSYFTKMINQEFFDIHIDDVIHLGISNDYIQSIEESFINEKEKNSILFAGRLVNVKNVDKLLKAMTKLENKVDFKLYIAGSGEDEEALKIYAKKQNINAEFLGRLSHEELYRYYQKADVFVSLNTCEPMGIVFFEALLNGCKIICPWTGGHVESMVALGKERCRFVDVESSYSIADAIKQLTQHSYPLLENDMNDFKYKNIAKKILKVISIRKD